MKSKYKNIKHSGYDSRKEAKRASELKLLEKSGIISNLEEQVAFVILESFKDSQGNTERDIKYIADFTYYDEEKRSHVIEDVKSPVSRKLPAYIMKRKLVKKGYPFYTFLES
jgi:hypothetical protein